MVLWWFSVYFCMRSFLKMRSLCAKGDRTRPREGTPRQGLEASRDRKAELQTFAHMQKYSSRHPYGICLQPSRLTQPAGNAEAVPLLSLNSPSMVTSFIWWDSTHRKGACMLLVSSWSPPFVLRSTV